MKRDLILDRIEEGSAVLTDKNANVIICDTSMLPVNSREGDALFGDFDDAGALTRLERRILSSDEKNRRRLSMLFAKNPKNKSKMQ